ncbi:hypothetical protein BDP67DRAFT_491580 [Colletotrichum lupini]|nr:hypothetical protein BDP67DRAFT_491580 [Colletotrichum lupini]
MEFVVYEDQVMSQDGMGGYSISEHRVDGPDCSVAEVFLCGHGVDWAVAVPGCSFAMEVKPREVGCAQWRRPGSCRESISGIAWDGKHELQAILSVFTAGVQGMSWRKKEKQKWAEGGAEPTERSRRSRQELSRPLLPFGNPECACDSDMVTSDDDWWIEDGKE